jgi:hypothetical protein
MVARTRSQTTLSTSLAARAAARAALGARQDLRSVSDLRSPLPLELVEVIVSLIWPDWRSKIAHGSKILAPTAVVTPPTTAPRMLTRSMVYVF